MTTCDENSAWQVSETCSDICQSGECDTCTRVAGPWFDLSNPHLQACADLPNSLRVTISAVGSNNNNSGYSDCMVCDCFLGSFVLTKTSDNIWSSAAIDGCVGQRTTAYIKYDSSRNLLGVNDQVSSPGFGSGNGLPAMVQTCSPLNIIGSPVAMGNSGAFCSDGVRYMNWTITP